MSDDAAPRVLLVAEAVITRADADVACGAAVLVENGQVVGVGPRDVLRRAAPLATVRELPGRILLPGFVDAHSHLRGLPTAAHDIADAPLERWVVRLAAMAPVDPAADALVAAVDALRTGVTTAQVIHHSFADATGYLDGVRAATSALVTAGLSAELIIAFTDQAEFVPTSVDAHLDDSQRRWLVPDRGIGADEVDAVVDAAATILDAAAGPGASHLRLGVGPVGPQWASDALLATIARHAGATRRVHTHAVETRAQRCWGPDSPIDRLARHGLLAAITSLAHGVHLTDAEAARLASHEVAIASCPTSNRRVSDGTGNVVGWLAAGIPVALGIDSVGHPTHPDAFAELRALQDAARHRGHHLDARTALSVATIGGARAVGRAEGIGAIEPGRRADIVAVRVPAGWRDGSVPDLIEALVATTTRDDVTDVLAGGRPVVTDGRHRAEDEVARARASLAATLRATAAERAERRARLAAIEPLVERIRRERTRAADAT